MGRSRLAPLIVAALLNGCVLTPVTFPGGAPHASLVVTAWRTTPAGPPPFRAVILRHGCEGASASTVAWAWWRGR